HVVGQLAVQEARGIGAAGAQHAPMGKRHEAVEGRGRVHATIIISAHDLHRIGVSQPMKWLLRTAFMLVLVAAVLAGGAAWWWLHRPLALATETVEYSIEVGTSPRDIAQGWVQAGVQ